MKHLQLDRPLAFFDLETTGVDPQQDRIVEIAVLRIEPDGSRESRCRRIDPGRPIPPEASSIHGIHDEDVRGEPQFKQIARGLLAFLDGADLAGFNIHRFDIPLLEREFAECGLDLGMAERRVVDAMTVFHRKEPRNLSAAVRFYLDREHSGAHAAEGDLDATLAVLEAQLERYDDLPRNVEGLDEWTRPNRNAVDRQGKFVRRGDEVVLAFGKHQGVALTQLASENPGYLEWVLESDFPEDAKQIVREVLGSDQSA